MTTSCWQVLGIDPTSDERAIKKAYALKLKVNKPDKNPTGFKALRAAYEQALDDRYYWEYEEDEFDEEAGNEYVDESDISSDNEFANESDQNFRQELESPLAAQLTAESADSAIKTMPDNMLGNASDNVMDTKPDDSILGSLIDHPLASSLQNELTNLETDLDTGLKTDLETEIKTSLETDLENELNSGIENTFTENTTQLEQWYQQWESGIADELPANQADQTLYQHLEQQFKQLSQCPLDTLDDYEQMLIAFFDNHPPHYSESYALAKHHFKWQQHLNTWESYDYPWYLVRTLDERYGQAQHFATKAQFEDYLLDRYYLVKQHWDFDLAYPQVPNRWHFFRKLWYPLPAYALNKQVADLSQELQLFHADSAPEVDWLNHPQLVTLSKRLGNFGMIRWQDFVLIALLSSAVIGGLATLMSHPAAFQEGVAVALILSAAYLYWQLQLSYLANPTKCLFNKETRWAWIAVSLGLWLLLFATTFIPSLQIDYYYANHIAGFSLLLAINASMRPANFRHIIWIHATLWLVYLVLLPMGFILTDQSSSYAVEFLEPTTPGVWLTMSVPLLLLTLGATYYRLRWLASLGTTLITLVSMGSALLALLILIPLGDIFFSTNLYFSFLILLLVVLVVFILMFETTTDVTQQASNLS